MEITYLVDITKFNILPNHPEELIKWNCDVHVIDLFASRKIRNTCPFLHHVNTKVQMYGGFKIWYIFQCSLEFFEFMYTNCGNCNPVKVAYSVIFLPQFILPS